MAKMNKRAKTLSLVERMWKKDPDVTPGHVVEAIEKRVNMSKTAARTYYYWAKDELQNKGSKKTTRAKKAA